MMQKIPVYTRFYMNKSREKSGRPQTHFEHEKCIIMRGLRFFLTDPVVGKMWCIIQSIFNIN